MKRFIVIFSILILGVSAWSQDSSKVKKTDNTLYFKAWKLSELLAIPDTVPIDTIYLNYQDQDPMDKFSIANSYNGNLGSPLQTKIYFKRPEGSDFLFDVPYAPYIRDINSARFYDLKFPYTNLTYRTGGASYRSEDNVKFIFTASPSEKMNFGFNLDYINSVGEYANQAVNAFSGDLFFRYSGKHYSANAYMSTNNRRNYENGGIADSLALDNANIRTLPTYMNITGYSAFKESQIYYNHSYSVGFNRKKEVTPDSITFEYVPVTHFGHTLNYQEFKKRYYEPSVVTSFYDTTYNKTNKITNDTAALRSLSNTFYINMDEKFNRLMKFGLTAFINNEIQQYTYSINDSTLTHDLVSSTRIGGELSKTQGSNFRYNLSADLFFIGYKAGEFHLNGKADGNFKLLGQNITLSAYAEIRNEEPSFFLQKYNSNHFRWDNNFNKIYRTSVGGLFSIPQQNLQLKIDVENVTNHIYFDKSAIPQQYTGNVQIVSADLKLGLQLSHIHLDNNVIYQISSNQDIIPLPQLSLYHNFYYLGKWFNVLTSQIGISMRMTTKYYTPDYMPATGQFYNQKTYQIGNYPLMNIYANFHLVRARFFAEYYHVNHLFMHGDYSTMPKYPLNPNVLKLGISWNFFN